MNKEDLLPESENPVKGNQNPTNTSGGGPDPEIDKDVSETVEEEKTENTSTDEGADIEGADHGEDGEDKTPETTESGSETRQDHGIENGDEDKQNPYPDESDAKFQK